MKKEPKKQKKHKTITQRKEKCETDMHFDPFSFVADVPSVLSLVNHIRCLFPSPFQGTTAVLVLVLVILATLSSSLLSLSLFILCVYVYEMCPCPVFSVSSLLSLVPVPALSVCPSVPSFAVIVIVAIVCP